MILDIFRSTITVIVSPKTFRFTTTAASHDIQTYLLIKDGRILGIGDDFEGSDRCQRIDLFEPQSQLVTNKAYYLDAFMRFGLRKVLKRKLGLRPRVLLRNTDSLESLCCGYQNSILRAAVMSSGAYECKNDGEQGNASH